MQYKMLNRVFWVFFALFLVISPAFSETEHGIDLQLQISSLPEAKVRLNYSITFPVLQGSGPLTIDNNLQAVFTAEVSPLSTAAIAEFTLTPIAFLQLHGGGRIGSGWNIGALGYGMGLRTPVGSVPGTVASPRLAEVTGSPFGGLVWRVWGAGTFQFSLDAVLPGDWNYLVFQSRQEFRYSRFTGAGQNDFWIYENDDGENRNGFVYYSSYTLGYMMPLSPILNFVGFMVEYERSMYSNLDLYWGENLGQWYLSTLMNFQITPNLSAMLAVQMRSRRNHGLVNFSGSSVYLQDLPISHDGGKMRFLFYRAALIVTYKIK